MRWTAVCLVLLVGLSLALTTGEVRRPRTSGALERLRMAADARHSIRLRSRLMLRVHQQLRHSANPHAAESEEVRAGITALINDAVEVHANPAAQPRKKWYHYLGKRQRPPPLPTELGKLSEGQRSLLVDTYDGFKAVCESPVTGQAERMLALLTPLLQRSVGTSWHSGEIVRLAMLKAHRMVEAGRADRRDNIAFALQGLIASDPAAAAKLLWADALSVQNQGSILEWLSSRYDTRLPDVQPAIEELKAHPQWGVLTQQEQRAVEFKILQKYRYFDLSPGDMVHADRLWAMLAITTEALTPDRVEAFLAPMPLGDLVYLSAVGHRTRTSEARSRIGPYSNIRDGPYRVSQALLRMLKANGQQFTHNSVSEQAKKDLGHLVRSLRSGWYLEEDVMLALRGTLGNGEINTLTDQHLTTIVDDLEARNVQRVQQEYDAFEQLVEGLEPEMQRIVGGQNTENAFGWDSVEFLKKIDATNLWKWFKDDFQKTEEDFQRHIYEEFVRIFGWRVLENPVFDSVSSDRDKSAAVAANAQILLQLRELTKERPDLYLKGLQLLAQGTPTAGKDLAELTYIESLVETMARLVHTINMPPVYFEHRYRKEDGSPARPFVDPEAKPRSEDPTSWFTQPAPDETERHRLADFPVFVFDQSDASNPARFAENKRYLEALAQRYSATIVPVSMADVVKFTRDLGVAEFFATSDTHPQSHWDDEQAALQQIPSAGYGGARNIASLLAAVWHKHKLVTTEALETALAKPANDRLRMIREVLNDHNSIILMGDDDMTLMPGFMHSKALLSALLVDQGYWRVTTLMMGRATTKIPRQPSEVASCLRDPRAWQSCGNAASTSTNFIYGFWLSDDYTMHFMAGVAMHLTTCVDLPLPTEEKLMDVHTLAWDLLGLGLHHPGDRYAEFGGKRSADMAVYGGQMRVASNVINADLKWPGVAESNQQPLVWNNIAYDKDTMSLGTIFTETIKTENKRKSQKGVARGLFIKYMTAPEPLLQGDALTLFDGFATRFPEVTQDPWRELRDDLAAGRQEYTKHIKDATLARRFVESLWAKLFEAFLALDDAPENLKQTLGAQAPALPATEETLGFVDWMIDNDKDLSQAVAAARADTANVQDLLPLMNSRLAKSVYLSAVSFLQGRLFSLMHTFLQG